MNTLGSCGSVSVKSIFGRVLEDVTNTPRTTKHEAFKSPPGISNCEIKEFYLNYQVWFLMQMCSIFQTGSVNAHLFATPKRNRLHSDVVQCMYKMF